jgi:hypothetical protein
MNRHPPVSRTIGIVVVSALCALGPTGCPAPAPAVPPGGPPPADTPSEPDADAGLDPAGLDPSDAETPEPDPAADPGPGAAAFRQVLAALASGSARAVRTLVPPGGKLVLLTHICRKPLYGVGNCRDERADVDRQQILDEPLARWQELLSRAAAADPPFVPDAAPVACSDADGGFSCRVEVPFGRDECRGDLRAVVTAVLRGAPGEWSLAELGYEEEILICR